MLGAGRGRKTFSSKISLALPVFPLLKVGCSKGETMGNE